MRVPGVCRSYQMLWIPDADVEQGRELAVSADTSTVDNPLSNGLPSSGGVCVLPKFATVQHLIEIVVLQMWPVPYQPRATPRTTRVRAVARSCRAVCGILWYTERV